MGIALNIGVQNFEHSFNNFGPLFNINGQFWTYFEHYFQQFLTINVEKSATSGIKNATGASRINRIWGLEGRVGYALPEETRTSSSVSRMAETCE